MTVTVKENLERIIKGIENAEQFNSEYPWREKGDDYTISMSKKSFNELKPYIPSWIEYVIVDEAPSCYRIVFWRKIK